MHARQKFLYRLVRRGQSRSSPWLHGGRLLRTNHKNSMFFVQVGGRGLLQSKTRDNLSFLPESHCPLDLGRFGSKRCYNYINVNTWLTLKKFRLIIIQGSTQSDKEHKNTAYHCGMKRTDSFRSDTNCSFRTLCWMMLLQVKRMQYVCYYSAPPLFPLVGI